MIRDIIADRRSFKAEGGTTTSMGAAISTAISECSDDDECPGHLLLPYLLLMRGAMGGATAGTKTMRISGPLIAFGLLGACVTDGNFADDGLGSSGIRWSGPLATNR